MKMIVGLGNPGEKYSKTRHNVGFRVVEELAENKSWSQSKSGLLRYCWLRGEDEEVELIKPLTYMNRSGEAVKYAFSKHKEMRMQDLYVVHDDLDIPLGSYKLTDKGPKVHNGVNSVRRVLGRDDFLYVRIGIDNREEKSIPGEKYVLGTFFKEEEEIVSGVIRSVVEKLKTEMFHD